MKKAIKRAIEGGYKIFNVETIDELEPAIRFYTHGKEWTKITSDPLFWQSLGKAEGWKEPEIDSDDFPEAVSLDLEQTGWNARWHRFIDHLAEGKSVDEFFNNLLK